MGLVQLYHCLVQSRFLRLVQSAEKLYQPPPKHRHQSAEARHSSWPPPDSTQAHSPRPAESARLSGPSRRWCWWRWVGCRGRCGGCVVALVAGLAAADAGVVIPVQIRRITTIFLTP